MKLHYKTFGEGFPMIILHGLFGSGDNWVSISKRFSEYYKVIVVDQRNHGHSPWSDEMNYDHLSQDLKELCDDLKIDKAIVLGHSMGGKTAMRFCQKYPASISKLIVADIGRKKYPMHHEKIIQGLSAIDFNVVKSRNGAKEILMNYIQDAGTLQFLLKNLYWIEKGQLAWRMNLPAIIENMDMILAEIPPEIVLTPTLFLEGEKSSYIEQSDYDDLLYYFPNSEFETIYNAGHWLHAENPIDFYDIVTDFLA